MSQPSNSQNSTQEFLSQETFNTVWADMSKMFTQDTGFPMHSNSAEFRTTSLPIQYTGQVSEHDTVEMNLEAYSFKPEMMSPCLNTSQNMNGQLQPTVGMPVQCTVAPTAIYTAPITYPEVNNIVVTQNGHVAQNGHVTHVSNDNAVAHVSSVVNGGSVVNGNALPVVNPIAQSMIPTNTEFAGNYGFEIGFQPEVYPPTKSVTWTHSEQLKKLFVKLKCLCPIKFKTRDPPPGQSFIRATVVFKKPEHYREVVQRCPNHITKFKAESQDFPYHLMRCENSNTEYETCQQTGRHSLKFPFNPCSAEYLTEMFQFLCFSSCPGGLNRRPIQIIFKLESNNQVLGQRVLDLRICACPGRDRLLAEDAPIRPGMNPNEEPLTNGCEESPDSVSPGTSKSTKKRVMGSSGPAAVITGFQVDGVTTTTPMKKAKIEEEEEEEEPEDDADDRIFTIQVRGRKNFELLLKIKDGIEIMDRVPTHVYRQYLPQHGDSPAEEGPVTTGSRSALPHTQTQDMHEAHEVNECFEEEKDIEDGSGTPPSSQIQNAFPYSQLLSQDSASSQGSSQGSSQSSQSTQTSTSAKMQGEIQAIKFTLRRTISLGRNGLPMNTNGVTKCPMKPHSMGKKLENLMV